MDHDNVTPITARQIGDLDKALIAQDLLAKVKKMKAEKKCLAEALTGALVFGRPAGLSSCPKISRLPESPPAIGLLRLILSSKRISSAKHSNSETSNRR